MQTRPRNVILKGLNARKGYSVFEQLYVFLPRAAIRTEQAHVKRFSQVLEQFERLYPPSAVSGVRKVGRDEE